MSTDKIIYKTTKKRKAKKITMSSVCNEQRLKFVEIFKLMTLRLKVLSLLRDYAIGLNSTGEIDEVLLSKVYEKIEKLEADLDNMIILVNCENS